jgi:hypothetical protein
MKRVVIGSTLDRSILAIAAALVLGTLTLSATTAGATSFDEKPKLLLHLKALTTKNQCTTWGNLTDCNAAVIQGGLSAPTTGPFYYMYLLVATGSLRGTDLGGQDQGIAGTQCGIQYNNAANAGVDVFTWTLCATLEFSSTGWPASGGGNLITWDSTNKCQKGEVAVAGYFYCGAYTADVFNVTTRPVDHAAKVADCASQEIVLEADRDLGSAEFSTAGTEGGCNPCLAGCGVPVKATTWSQIKGIYGGR